ncbi:efflux transporter outer membrane subunit [Stenotrophomonas koreensis]|nr:TolC family protein [Stenotrophomonas koreensis]
MIAPRTLLLSLAVSAALAGCATPGANPAADIRVPAAWGQTSAPTEAQPLDVTAPAADIATDGWWRGFNNAQLDALIDQVLASNTDLAVAGLRLQRARLQAGLASADLWPSANGSLGVSGNRRIDSGDDWSEGYSASVSLGWELDLWGKLRAQRDIAQWEAAATAEDQQNTALLLVSQAAELYWQIGYLNLAIRSGQANLERLQRIGQLVDVQYRAGTVSMLEVRQAAQNLEAQKSSQAQLEQQRVEARNALTVLLDGQPWPVEREAQNLDGFALPGVAPGLPAQLLARRPDLRAAELRLRQALKQIKVTATSYYPSLSLSGSVGGSSTDLAEVLANPVASLGAGLSLPFLRLRQMQLNIESSDLTYQIAANQFRDTLYSALAEVDNALSAREKLAVQLAASQASHDHAVEIERLYEVRYRAGATDLRNWLDAQQTRRNAELSLAQARRSVLVNQTTLYKALGGSDRSQP